MRFGVALCGALLLGNGAIAARAADCPGHPDAMGVSRTIVVDPREHPQIGTVNYSETLPLADKEVVLTFDDGPHPPYSSKVLDVLASECIKATFFVVGQMAKEYPAVLKRMYDEGHSIGTHSWSHPIYFDNIPTEKSIEEIDQGIAAAQAVLGDGLSPFFRYPGFGRTMLSEDHLTKLGIMVWSTDVMADDWLRVGAGGIISRMMTRLEARGRGILMLHDVNPASAVALPTLLKQLKAKGYKIVHVVAAKPDQPRTPTAWSEWTVSAAMHRRWPRIAAFVADSSGELPLPRTDIFGMPESYEKRQLARAKMYVKEEITSPRKRTVERMRTVDIMQPVPPNWPKPESLPADIEPALVAPSRDNAGVDYALKFNESGWQAPEPVMHAMVDTAPAQVAPLRVDAHAMP